MADELKYGLRGVSAQKEDVHKATENLDKGLYPNAFCKIYPDYLGGSDAYCNIVHADGTGTKSILAYLYWKETGDLSVWKSLAQDAIVMNTDDLACVGVVDNFLYSSILNRNKHLIPGEVISAIIEGTSAFFEMLKSHDVHVHFMGGETADLGDIVRTITVDGTMTCRMPKSRLITNEKIQAGDVIVGLASFGQTTYEKEYNSGIGSNGLTSARHDVLNGGFIIDKYPEAYDQHIPEELLYTGSKKITDETGAPLNVGKLLLSPTRTYLPVLKKIFARHFDAIHGIVHCTGGAQTKILHYIDDLHVIKDNLFTPPAVFQLIQSESATPWKEMYEVLNMGHRMEIYTDGNTAQSIIGLAGEFKLDARIIGRCEKGSGKRLTIGSEYGIFEYHK